MDSVSLTFRLARADAEEDDPLQTYEENNTATLYRRPSLCSGLRMLDGSVSVRALLLSLSAKASDFYMD